LVFFGGAMQTYQTCKFGLQNAGYIEACQQDRESLHTTDCEVKPLVFTKTRQSMNIPKIDVRREKLASHTSLPNQVRMLSPEQYSTPALNLSSAMT
jgi:hypothetical protein